MLFLGVVRVYALMTVHFWSEEETIATVTQYSLPALKLSSLYLTTGRVVPKLVTDWQDTPVLALGCRVGSSENSAQTSSILVHLLSILRCLLCFLGVTLVAFHVYQGGCCPLFSCPY